jgi:membrane-bound inhibitor of C-type lysozyme
MFHSLSALRATASCVALLTFLSTPSTLANTLVPGTLAQDAPPTPGLKIVVLEGEQAVNVVRKRTVVMPVVQVLDQSGKPVAGAEVTFFAPGDGASVQFTDGSRSATITTDAEGKASPIGGVAINAGEFEYQVTALFHEQRATASIKQSNVTSQGTLAKSGSGGTAHSSHLVWWVVGGVAAVAAIGIGVGLGHGGSTAASSSSSATIGAGSGLTVGAPH